MSPVHQFLMDDVPDRAIHLNAKTTAHCPTCSSYLPINLQLSGGWVGLAVGIGEARTRQRLRSGHLDASVPCHGVQIVACL